MKKIIFTAIFALITTTQAGAQCKNGKNFDPQRFQAELEQFITQKAGLTPQEAARFFPVYAEMMKKQRALHDEQKSLKRVKPLTDAECKKNIQKQDELGVQIRQVQQTYHNKFMHILSPAKVYDVLKAEDQFHRQAFKRAADKKNDKDRKQKPKHPQRKRQISSKR